MRRKKENSSVLSVYVTDYKKYKELQEAIRLLWYHKYGESLTKGDCLIKSMLFLEDYLKKSDTVATSPTKSSNSTLADFFRFRDL